MTDVEWITAMNHNNRRRRDRGMEKAEAHLPSLLYGLTGSAITVAVILASSGRWGSAGFVLFCAALFVYVGKTLEKDVVR